MKSARFIVIAGAAVLVLAADFPWGDWQGHTHWSKIGWVPFVSPPVRVLDIAQNVALGVPIGVCAALYFRRAPTVAALIAFVASFTGEWTQVYSHRRFPSATDVVCNVSGAIAAALFTGWLARRAGRDV